MRRCGTRRRIGGGGHVDGVGVILGKSEGNEVGELGCSRFRGAAATRGD